MRCRIAATPTSRRRSTRSSTTSRAPSRPTAISTAGTTAANPTSAGPTCATTTSSTTPAICSKARSPISAPPAAGASSTSWSATSTTSRRPSAAAPGQKRGYDGHQEIELALVKLYRLTGDRRRLDLAAYFIDERGRQPPHYFTAEAIGARRRPGRLLGGHLRIQPVAPAGARTDQDGRSRGAGDVHGLGDGRSRPRTRRRRAQARLRGAVARRDEGADVRHRRPRAEGEQRGLHRALRPAQRDRLRRDLRFGRAGLLGAAHAASRSRRRLRRRDGARAVQWRAERPVARRNALFLRQSAGEPRPASALGMAHLPVLHDERLAAGRFGRRLLRCRPPTTASPSISTAASPPRRSSPASGCRSARPATTRGRATSASPSIPRRRRPSR